MPRLPRDGRKGLPEAQSGRWPAPLHGGGLELVANNVLVKYAHDGTCDCHLGVSVTRGFITLSR